MAGPLEQFKIQPLIKEPMDVFGMDVYFTNSSLFMVLALVGVILFTRLGMRKQALVPGRMQSMVEMSYNFIANVVRSNAGVEAMRYFPFMFTIFMFILFGNLLGLIPYGFTFTSHIIVTFILAMVVFVLVTFVGFARHGLKFFKFFFPQGVPLVMAPLIIPIEIFSYLVRPVSLSIRLFANMMAGHTMIKLFATFTVSLGIFGIAPLLFNSVLIGFEVFIAILQAYIFTILSCIYLHDSIHLH